MIEALLLIDYVNDIVHPDGAVSGFGTPQHVIAQKAVENTKAVLAHARKKGIKIIFVRVAFKAGHPELKDAKALFYRAHIDNNWLVKGTWGTDFYTGLESLDSEVVMEKHRVNPFTNPRLVQEIRGIDRIVITGVATNLSVEETVRNAAALDFAVTVLEDCCASNNQAMHEFAITQIFPKFATVSNSEEYLKS
jgi:nicotinamidase-related amidase